MTKEIALVTGCSRGIGKAVVLELAAQGYYVIGTDLNDELAQSITDYIKEAGFEGEGRVLNVNDQEAIDEIIKSISKDFGAPTVLVNNAGITKDNLLMRMKDEEWDMVVNTNLSSIFRMSRAVLRGMMKAKKGRIVNIGSVVGLSGNPGQANYCATKAGVVGFSKSMAQEVASRGITVNVVAPGFIDTEMTKALSDEQREALASKIPLGRLGEVEDIAKTVAFLVSDGAGFITGETISVNGGMYMS
ncbi:MAG: 3-oxoacyl-ACP reductase FabG [Gammaproteobacteria bacterium]|nr:MAG: 3-oxoacyl-ACP reductase FabG [Gammaproteobacteria bacterium]